MIHEPIALIVIDMQRGMKGPHALERNNAGVAIYKMREARAVIKGNT